MQFEEAKDAGYFSVTYTVVLGQMRCVPQVCYKLSDDVRLAVEKMVRDGLAQIYSDEVRFISGSPVPVKKRAASPRRTPASLHEALGRAAAISTVSAVRGMFRKGRRSKPQREFE